MTTLQKVIVTATIAAAVGTGVFEAHRASALRNQVREQPSLIRFAPVDGPSRTNAGSHSPPPPSVSLTVGCDRQAVYRELERIHATTLMDSPELLRAEFQAPTRMVQVELGFIDGKLTKVNSIPQ